MVYSQVRAGFAGSIACTNLSPLWRWVVNFTHPLLCPRGEKNVFNTTFRTSAVMERGRRTVFSRHQHFIS